MSLRHPVSCSSPWRRSNDSRVSVRAPSTKCYWSYRCARSHTNMHIFRIGVRKKFSMSAKVTEYARATRPRMLVALLGARHEKKRGFFFSLFHRMFFNAWYSTIWCGSPRLWDPWKKRGHEYLSSMLLVKKRVQKKAIPLHWDPWEKGELTSLVSLLFVVACKCVAGCCSVLQCDAAQCLLLDSLLYIVACKCVVVCCSVLQRVAVCCSVLQRNVYRLSLSSMLLPARVLQCVAVRCSLLQCDAVCCSVLQCVAVCCSVLQCVAATCLSLVPLLYVALVRALF